MIRTNEIKHSMLGMTLRTAIPQDPTQQVELDELVVVAELLVLLLSSNDVLHTEYYDYNTIEYS